MFEDLVRELSRRNAEAVERACERSLLTDFGVLVTPHSDGTITAEVSPEVPFGHIYYKSG